MKKFIKTPQMIAAAEATFLAMAAVKTLQPIVTAYQKAILAEGQWCADSKMVRCDVNPENRVILDPKHSYLLPEASFQEYLTKTKAARDAAGLKVEHDENCPLLVAENELVKAKRALIDSLEQLTGIGADTLLCAGMDEYNRYTELSLQLVAPFVKSASELMKTVVAA